jgi:hypothetical protein
MRAYIDHEPCRTQKGACVWGGGEGGGVFVVCVRVCVCVCVCVCVSESTFQECVPPPKRKPLWTMDAQK